MKWTKPNGHWERNGQPCRPVETDFEEMIAERDARITRLTIDNDNLHERIRKLDSDYSLDDYASRLPV